MPLVVLMQICHEITTPRLINHKHGYGKLCQEALMEDLQIDSQFCESLVRPQCQLLLRVILLPVHI